MSTTLIYELAGRVRPRNNWLARMFLLLNRIPVLRRLKLVELGVRRQFSMPNCTSFNEGFYCSASSLLTVGKNVGLADTNLVAWARITIGDGTSFSFRNMLITSTHDVSNFSTVIAKPITIGNNVWITSNVTILPGVSIGSGTIIGAGSVVTHDIPANVLAAGNPCKVIKQIQFIKNQ